MGVAQLLKEPPPEPPREHPHGGEEAAPAGAEDASPSRPLSSTRSGRYKVVLRMTDPFSLKQTLRRSKRIDTGCESRPYTHPAGSDSLSVTEKRVLEVAGAKVEPRRTQGSSQRGATCGMPPLTSRPSTGVKPRVRSRRDAVMRQLANLSQRCQNNKGWSRSSATSREQRDLAANASGVPIPGVIEVLSSTKQKIRMRSVFLRTTLETGFPGHVLHLRTGAWLDGRLLA